MEKIKYYGPKGYVDKYEPSDYVVRAMSKALAVQLKEKITPNKAWLLAMSLFADGYDGDKELMDCADAYEIVMYFTLKCKIESFSDAWDDISEKFNDEFKRLKLDKEQLLIAFSYLACCGFINNLGNE